MARLKFAVLAMLAAVPVQAARKPSAMPAPAAAAPAPLVPSVRGGVELWRNGDYAGAVAMWMPIANTGDADAMFNIGQAYKLGRALPKDAVTARDYYRRAATKGHLPAQANLGIMLFQAGEKAEAIRWLRAAADKNEMRAQYVLGVANWNGDGTPRNLTLAYAYLSRASALGLAEATSALAGLTNVIPSVERANGWEVATSIAAGRGVPPQYAGGPAMAVAAADRFSREQVIKPLPKPLPRTEIAQVVPPPAAAGPAPQVSAASPQAVSAAPPQVVAATPPKTAPTPMPPVAVASAAPPVAKPPAEAASPPITAKLPPKPLQTVSRLADTANIPATPPPVTPRSTAKTPVQIAVVTRPKPAGWRVQLGAFGRRAQAEAAWTEVKTKQKQLVANSKPIYEEAGKITKLQLGPFPTKIAASTACAKIAFSGRACFVTEG